MKSRGLDQAIIEAANRNVTVVGICGGYQILGQQLDDPDATESPEPQSEPGLGLLPTSTIFDTQKTTRRVNIEIPAHDSGPLKGPTATGIGYEIHTGITTGITTSLATLTDDHSRVPSKAEGPGGDVVKTSSEVQNAQPGQARNPQNSNSEKCHPETLEGCTTNEAEKDCTDITPLPLEDTNCLER